MRVYFARAEMRFLRWFLPVYAPLLALAAASFWLSPGSEIAPPPDYAAALHDARYTRAESGGVVLHLSAGRVEYDDGAAALFTLQLSRAAEDGGRIALRGERGQAQSGESGARQIAIENVYGEIAGGGKLLTLRADSVLYDFADGGLSGVLPRISGGGGLSLRGEEFAYRADSGWKIKGNVQGVYQR